MLIPFYRCVRDADDGCVICQCLHCGETWEWRGGSGKVRFCLFCGTAIEWRETRDSDTPRWKHDLEMRSGDNWPEVRCRLWREESAKRDARKPEPYWVLVERCFYEEGRGERLLRDWEAHNLLGCGYRHPLSAHDAYEILLRKREQAAAKGTPDDPDYTPADELKLTYRYEYRLRRVPG